MMTVKEYKGDSIRLLSKCWGEASFILIVNLCGPLISYLTIILIGSLAGIHDPSSIMPVFTEIPVWFAVTAAAILILTYILTAPVYFGTRWFFRYAARGKFMPVSSVFASYSSKASFKKAVSIRLYIGFRKLAYLIPCAAAVALESDISHRLQTYYTGETAGLLFTLGMAVFIFCVVVIYFMMTMKYIPVGFLIIEDPDSDLHATLSRTRSIIIRKRRRILNIYASFAGWFLSCLLFFPLLFVYPYVLMTLALFIDKEFDGLSPEMSDDIHNITAEKSLLNV
ncbi:MAG: hypothetical protein ACI4KF_01920 [Huintestinicola sp.]